jgi:hypothetical protein
MKAWKRKWAARLIVHQVRIFGRPVLPRRNVAVYVLYRMAMLERYQRFALALKETGDAVEAWTGCRTT